MKVKSYLKDKLYQIILYAAVVFILTMFLFAYKIPQNSILYLIVIFTVFFITSFLIDYFRKSLFYKNLLGNIENLDKAYLVLETISKPTFYEGELIYQALYEINKSMNENVKVLETQTNDFKEYIELWIHEVKIPISSLVLIAHNHPDKFDKKSLEQIRRIENYVEQVLYYVRQESAEKDYLIKKVNLNKIISNVALKNKDDLLENKIDLIVENTNYDIYTDSKWLEFIINQVVNNSIKYHSNVYAFIKITATNEADLLKLTIEDNGIGIDSSDLPKVFNKSFTGVNGHKLSKSTGMGLYIAKNLCLKLGHKIEISSRLNEYTKVTITFSKNKFYDVIK